MDEFPYFIRLENSVWLGTGKYYFELLMDELGLYFSGWMCFFCLYEGEEEIETEFVHVPEIIELPYLNFEEDVEHS